MVKRVRIPTLERLDTSRFKLASFRNILLSPAVLILVATYFSYQGALWYFRNHIFWREPHGEFFNDEHVYDLGYSRERQRDAADFLAQAANDSASSPTHAYGPLLCAGIATVKRRTDYLNGTIGTMFATLTPEERGAMEVRLTFVSAHPEDHPDWDQGWLNLVDFHGGYNVTETEMEQLRTWEADDKWIQWKGVWDYTYLLLDCYERSNAPYIAVFEDDIIFAEGWMSKTLKALAELREMSIEWLYLRLFYTETFHVFWKKRDFFHHYRGVAHGTGAGATAFMLLLLRGCSRTVQRRIYNDASTTGRCWSSLALPVPKHSLKGTGLTRMDAACCTQALVFPRSQVLDVIDYLLERERGQTDLMIEKYADELGIARFAVEPQQVQHVGVKSSRGGSKKTVWAHLFETYNGEALREEHVRMAKGGRTWRPQDDGLSDVL
ncbi:uncharacterized protein LTR77_004155 [Saxophila tyrrhenica]|uniref:Uncharacterized protein n=1 Tax=Saxophila tyrrhenica TaxID=1690608 RepID=A0AAV9PBZ8_9PEZI|nr:hypothetical protein LTR77_004155 [Saxophila tyrrhenica]